MYCSCKHVHTRGIALPGEIWCSEIASVVLLRAFQGHFEVILNYSEPLWGHSKPFWAIRRSLWGHRVCVPSEYVIMYEYNMWAIENDVYSSVSQSDVHSSASYIEMLVWELNTLGTTPCPDSSTMVSSDSITLFMVNDIIFQYVRMLAPIDKQVVRVQRSLCI